MIEIDDPADERFAQFRLNERALSNRRQRRDDAGAGLFLAEGDLVVERALDAGCIPVAALVDRDRVPPIVNRIDCPVYCAGLAVRQVVTRLGLPQLIVALFERPPRPSADELIEACSRLVVLEGVDNPANVGSVIRNAAGLGWDGLLLDHTSADPLARRSLRVAMGTAFTLPHARTTDLAGVLAEVDDMDLLALTPAANAVPIADVVATLDPSRRRAVLLGSERDGLSAELLALATPVRIPMSATVDSLNVAAATAIACFALG